MILSAYIKGRSVADSEGVHSTCVPFEIVKIKLDYTLSGKEDVQLVSLNYEHS